MGWLGHAPRLPGPDEALPGRAERMPVPDELLQILRCIECHEPVEQVDDALHCTGCGLRYPVEDDIPVMLPEAAYRGDET